MNFLFYYVLFVICLIIIRREKIRFHCVGTCELLTFRGPRALQRCFSSYSTGVKKGRCTFNRTCLQSNKWRICIEFASASPRTRRAAPLDIYSVRSIPATLPKTTVTPKNKRALRKATKSSNAWGNSPDQKLRSRKNSKCKRESIN